MVKNREGSRRAVQLAARICSWLEKRAPESGEFPAWIAGAAQRLKSQRNMVAAVVWGSDAGCRSEYYSSSVKTTPPVAARPRMTCWTEHKVGRKKRVKCQKGEAHCR